MVVNTSKTDSTLPNNPDTNATPSLPTLTAEIDVPVRIDSYVEPIGAIAASVDETLQVPSEYTLPEEIANFNP